MKRTKKGRVQFRAAPNSPISDEEAKIYGPEVWRLTETHGGKLTPAELVEEAKRPDSILHDHFQWDDRRAAELYRIRQARKLIASIRIIVLDEHGRSKPMRSFFNVHLEEDEHQGRAYVTIKRVREDEELRRQVIGEALREAHYWADKYREYKELQHIRFAIQETMIRLQSKNRKTKKK